MNVPSDYPELKVPFKSPYEVVGWRIMNLARYCFSFLPRFGFVRSPPRRPNGVSVIVRSCNDEWIEPSLRSIRDFADEIIVVDVSTDDTPMRVRRVAEEEGLNIKLIHMSIPLESLMGDTETYVYHSNIGLRYAKYRWAVIWDPDFVAYTNGPNNIMNLKDILLNLDPKIYYRVNVGFLYLDGDLFHIGPEGFRIRREVFAFTWSPRIKFYDAGRFEIIKFPLYYRRIIIPKIYAVHLVTVKNAKYILYRKYWTDWRENRDFQRFPTVQDYVRHRLKTDYGIESEQEGIKRAFMELASRLTKFEYLLKYCPEELKEEIKEPRYKILYDEDGRIIGRNDIGRIL